ncbi:MAG: hypothetical protein ACO1OK_10355 [Devosia sp.]
MLRTDPNPVAARMAGIMIERRAATGSCLEADLLDEFARAEVEQHRHEARRIASDLWVRRVETPAHRWQTDKHYRRTRVLAAASLIAGETDVGIMTSTLRRRGYELLEIAELWTEILEVVADIAAVRIKSLTFPGFTPEEMGQ